jgi:hypothetical protein
VRLGVGGGTWELGEFCESRCCALARPRTRQKHCTRASQVIGIALESALRTIRASYDIVFRKRRVFRKRWDNRAAGYGLKFEIVTDVTVPRPTRQYENQYFRAFRIMQVISLNTSTTCRMMVRGKG